MSQEVTAQVVYPTESENPIWRSQAWLLIELILLFGLVPLALMERLIPLHPLAIAAIVAAGCALFLRRDPTYPTRDLWDRQNVRPMAARVLPLYLLGIAIFFLGVWFFLPDKLLSLPRHHPGVWLAVLLIYPIFSVYPQEVIYRAFFFHRYRPLLGDGWMVILVSAIAFGWMHILFRNSFAVILCTVGGVVFGLRYRQTRSLLVTCIEHTLYGWLVFTIGLGEFIMSGGTLSVVAGH